MGALFSWEGFWEIASSIRRGDVGEDSEAWRRTCVGRAYYACFNQAKLMWRRRFGEWPAGEEHEGAHAALLRHLKEAGDPAMQELADNINIARVARRHADYNPKEFRQHQAALALLAADQAWAMLKGLMGTR